MPAMPSLFCARLRANQRLLHTTRRLGQHFLVLGYDGTDSEALSRRNAARDDHISRAQAAKDAGLLLSAAAMINDQGNMCGSALTMDFPDRAALDKWLRDEPYVTRGVWKDIKITPVRLAPLK